MFHGELVCLNGFSFIPLQAGWFRIVRVAFWNVEFSRARQEQINQTGIRRMGDAPQRNGIFVLDGYFQVPTRDQVELLPDRLGQANLTLRATVICEQDTCSKGLAKGPLALKQHPQKTSIVGLTRFDLEGRLRARN